MRYTHILLTGLLLLAACTSTATSPAAPTEPPSAQTTAAATEPPPTETSTPEPTATPAQEWGIAFAVVDPASIDGGPRPIMTLHVIRADGTGLHPITGEIMNLNGLTASPDGQYLLFSANREDTSGDDFISWNDLGHLYVVEVQSGTIFTLTSGTETQEWKSGDWSPDGEYIAYGSERGFPEKSMHYALCVIRRDGTDNVCMPERAGLIWHVAWSPTGEQIAFEQSGGIWMVNPDGSDLHKAADAQIAENEIYYARPAWSPDGEHIAFAAPGTGEEQDADIFIVNPDGSNLVNITNHPSKDILPTWPPQGDQLAFLTTRHGTFTLYTTNIEESQTEMIFADPLADTEAIWSPDGTHLVFIAGAMGEIEKHLFIVNLADKSSLRLNEQTIGDHPAWVILPQN